jgi:hypothetical protein
MIRDDCGLLGKQQNSAKACAPYIDNLTLRQGQSS